MRQSNTETLQLSRRYLDLIGGQPMSLAEKQAFIAETVEAYEKHVNRGFISYRKSVTEAGQFAALEWSGHGAVLEDLLGREYIDCLGGYGIFSAGINHPRIVKAVQDQMARMALNSQELLEPWRAGLARAASKGEFLLKELTALQAKYPSVLSGVRGKGLLIGLEFPSDAIGYQCAGALFRRGVLVAGTYSKARTIRIEPPLGIPMNLLREMLNRLEDSLKAIAPAGRTSPVARASALEVQP